jgi:16S rRNA (uracil1498-N3)-methyltransferase
MRAQYLADLTIQDSYHLKGEDAHHLISVVRVELNEPILLLDGKGLKVQTLVESISKRELSLKTVSHETETEFFRLNLALGIPKKEALELCLKQAVELGFRRIFLIRSAYSQTKLPESERVFSLLVSALEQSNAAYLPTLINSSWEELPFAEFDEVVLMDSQSKRTDTGLKPGKSASRLLVVGPEGGFSPGELEKLHRLKNASVVQLPCPILRSPTALAAGAGLIMGRLLD